MPAFTISRRILIILLVSVSATIAILAVALGPAMDGIFRAAGASRLRAPDFSLLAAQSFAVQLHVYTALAALGIGTFVMVRPKGTGMHKTLGWAWVATMATTAISSLFITELNGGFFSFVHLFSGWTLVALPMGIYAIRRRQLRGHRSAMTGVFIGGLLVAGAFTFIPGRLMWTMFFG